MQPNMNGNMPGMSNGAPSSVPQTAPMNSGGDVVFRDKPKKNKGMIVGMIILALLAAGGIGFGVWAFLSGNQKVADLNNQISDLNNQLAEQPEIDETTIVDVNGYENPVIKSTNPDEEYRVIFSSSNLSNTLDSVKRLNISVKNGKVDSCNINTSVGNGSFSSTDCTINGLEGDIYKVIEFGAGQDNSGNNIGFIMSDGKIKYLPLFDAVNNNDFHIRGELNINGYVADVIEITAGASDPNITAGGYGSTIFVLNDGSFVKYDDSMLN